MDLLARYRNIFLLGTFFSILVLLLNVLRGQGRSRDARGGGVIPLPPFPQIDILYLIRHKLYGLPSDFGTGMFCSQSIIILFNVTVTFTIRLG